ncbi:hypothetical protein SEA_DARDANUS_64 [Gordonia phage Dardanus]|uniref:Uncharacterized protein n=1 Tax=Gordonia phage Dardanus TaxID=2588489 RepID=A0A514CX90_9CAUD|nr:hypothetical protein KDJ58_gp64 [Gordonia phage Dardanus]QDH85101.1 hypothetical protein SEA_DARDANUS_64 [Gordonia phage Dardanus]
MTDQRREFTSDQLEQWVYDHEYDYQAEPPDEYDGAQAAKWYEDHPRPSDTFPPYYAEDFGPTVAALCREVLELRQLVVAKTRIDGALYQTAAKIEADDLKAARADGLEAVAAILGKRGKPKRNKGRR